MYTNYGTAIYVALHDTMGRPHVSTNFLRSRAHQED